MSIEELNSEIDKLSTVSDKDSMVNLTIRIDEMIFSVGKTITKSDREEWESLFKRYRDLEKSCYLRIMSK